MAVAQLSGPWPTAAASGRQASSPSALPLQGLVIPRPLAHSWPKAKGRCRGREQGDGNTGRALECNGEGGGVQWRPGVELWDRRTECLSPATGGTHLLCMLYVSQLRAFILISQRGEKDEAISAICIFMSAECCCPCQCVWLAHVCVRVPGNRCPALPPLARPSSAALPP